MKSIYLFSSTVFAATTFLLNAQVGSFENITPANIKVGIVPSLKWKVSDLPLSNVEDIITIGSDYKITTKPAQTFAIRHLIASVNYNNAAVLSDYKIIKSDVKVGGNSWANTFTGVIAGELKSPKLTQDIPRPGVLSIAAAANTVISFRANDAQNNTYYYTVTNPGNARVYKNGQGVPDRVGAGGQPSLKDTPYLINNSYFVTNPNYDANKAINDITNPKKLFKLTSRQVILVFDTTHTDQTNGGFDLNDYVGLVTFTGEPTTYTHTIIEKDLKNNVQMQHLNLPVEGDSINLVTKLRKLSDKGSNFKLYTRKI